MDTVSLFLDTFFPKKVTPVKGLTWGPPDRLSPPYGSTRSCTTTAADELALLAIDAAGRVAPPPSLLQPTMASANKHAVQPLMAFIWEE